MTCDDCALLRQENNELRRQLDHTTARPLTTSHHDPATGAVTSVSIAFNDDAPAYMVERELLVEWAATVNKLIGLQAIVDDFADGVASDKYGSCLYCYVDLVKSDDHHKDDCPWLRATHAATPPAGT